MSCRSSGGRQRLEVDALDRFAHLDQPHLHGVEDQATVEIIVLQVRMNGIDGSEDVSQPFGILPSTC